MADLSDVENAILNQIAGLLYPNGPAEASAAGVLCRIYRGWPAPAALNADLLAGNVNVTVFPAAITAIHDEILPPYLDQMQGEPAPVTLTATVSANRVIFAGTVTPDQMIGILVDNVPYVYTTSPGDTPGIITAILAAQIRVNRPVSVAGSTLTVPGAGSLKARTGARGPSTRVLRRQRRQILAGCWCPSSALRDTVARIVDSGLARQTFITLNDSTKAHLHYVSTQVYDQSQSASLYRRDISYMCTYMTTQTLTLPAMLFGTMVKDGLSTTV